MAVRYFIMPGWNTIPGNVNPAERIYPVMVECDTELERPTQYMLVGDTAYCLQEQTTWRVVSIAPVVYKEFSGGQPGPPGPSGGTFTAENKDASPILAGQPVAIHTSGVGIILASATSPGEAAIGLATEDIGVGFSGKVMVSGSIDVSDWTAATGSPTLPARSILYLDTVAGKMTPTPSSGSGNVVQEIMRSISTVKARLSIEEPILI